VPLLGVPNTIKFFVSAIPIFIVVVYPTNICFKKKGSEEPFCVCASQI